MPKLRCSSFLDSGKLISATTGDNDDDDDEKGELFSARERLAEHSGLQMTTHQVYTQSNDANGYLFIRFH
jgi:hypothetical protein